MEDRNTKHTDTDLVAKETGTRYCPKCGTYRSVAFMKRYKGPKVTYWMCDFCRDKAKAAKGRKDG